MDKINRIIFKKEIDSIYEKLYSINEGLSSVESNDFIRGYQAGIKEGYKIFQEHINEENPFTFVNEVLFGNIARGIGKVVGGAKGLFQQGKQMAASAWKTVGDFATQVINKVKNGITTAASWVAEQPAKIKEYLTGIYNQAVDDMKSAFETLKDKAKELAQSITNIWNSVLEGIKSGINAAKAKISQTEESAKVWYDKNYQLVISQCEEWKRSGIDWAVKAGQTVSDVFAKVKSGTLAALKVVGIAVAIIIAGPFYLLIKGIQQVPELYKLAQKQVNDGISAIGNYWMTLQQEYAAGWNQGMAKTGVHEKRVLLFTEFVNEKKKMS